MLHEEPVLSLSKGTLRTSEAKNHFCSVIANPAKQGEAIRDDEIILREPPHPASPLWGEEQIPSPASGRPWREALFASWWPGVRENSLLIKPARLSASWS